MVAMFSVGGLVGVLVLGFWVRVTSGFVVDLV